jgi:hypothetical protein
MNQKQRWRRTTRSLYLTLVEIYCKANTKVVKALHILFSNDAKLTLIAIHLNFTMLMIKLMLYFYRSFHR